MQRKRTFWLLAWTMTALLSGGWAVSPAAATEAATVSITSPAYDSAHVLGESIVFSCSVKSTASGEIPKVQVIWTSQLDGKIGEGALLKIDTLTVGIHRITVEAYNEAGASLGTASIKLKVNQTKSGDNGTGSGSAPIGVGKGEPYVVNPFN